MRRDLHPLAGREVSVGLMGHPLQHQKHPDLGSGLEISLFMGCAKRDKGQAFRIGPQEEEKTYNSRLDPFDPSTTVTRASVMCCST
jgi:hypothetical protein